MAVIIDMSVEGATLDKVYAVEGLTSQRGEAAGGPPYTGCMFLAATLEDDRLRIVAAWRTEADFRDVLETMLQPDFASVGLDVRVDRVQPAVSMAIPGAHTG
jgi:hypothetical protein